MNSEPALDSTMSAERLELTAVGSWTIAHSEVLERLVNAAALQLANARSVAINMAGVQELDTLGAWLLERLIRVGRERGQQAEYTLLPEHFRGLLDEMREVNSRPGGLRAKPSSIVAALDSLGRA